MNDMWQRQEVLIDNELDMCSHPIYLNHKSSMHLDQCCAIYDLDNACDYRVQRNMTVSGRFLMFLQTQKLGDPVLTGSAVMSNERYLISLLRWESLCPCPAS